MKLIEFSNLKFCQVRTLTKTHFTFKMLGEYNLSVAGRRKKVTENRILLRNELMCV